MSATSVLMLASVFMVLVGAAWSGMDSPAVWVDLTLAIVSLLVIALWVRSAYRVYRTMRGPSS